MRNHLGSASLGALLLAASLLVPIAPVAAAPQAPAELLAAPAGDAAGIDRTAAGIAARLRQSWQADPASSSLPWPGIEVLPAGQTPQAACPAARPGGSSAGAVQTPALHCAASGRVLLDRARLAKDSNRHGDWGVAYWVGVGLGQAIRDQRAAPLLPPAAANLQFNCLAGVLVGGTNLPPTTKDPPKLEELVAPANGAYATAAAGPMGTRSQRSYAWLTGLGMTELGGCSDAAMVQLALDRVPDPALLAELAMGADRGAFNTLGVMNRRCRRLANSTCPRRLPSFAGQK